MLGTAYSTAEIELPSAQDCLTWGAPVVALIALACVISQAERIVDWIYPDLEWEHSLGWLNIRAQRRANWAFRFLMIGMYVLLFDSLCGIYWATKTMPPVDQFTDPYKIGDFMLRLPMLGLCLAVWIVYIGCGLLPRLRAERNAAALKKLRAEDSRRASEQAIEPEEERKRVHTPLPKPRANPVSASGSTLPSRFRYRGPGG